jgi:hypothetical protein
VRERSAVEGARRSAATRRHETEVASAKCVGIVAVERDVARGELRLRRRAHTETP